MSQKELEKALHEAKSLEDLERLHKLEARIEFIGDIEDVKLMSDMLRTLGKE